MALASLCSKSTTFSETRQSFVAFIVDHDLRPGSASEAELVAERIRKLDIDAKVLKLEWPTTSSTTTSHQSRVSNIESEARRLRFRALGRACHSQSVESLLLAHHADDQAETVLFRVLHGYTGAGLQGIKAKADIPECYGIWGVGRSGSPRLVEPNLRIDNPCNRILVENGGVQLHRPLLDARKQDLYAHCVQHRVQWVEDHTNFDPALTPRNAIRSLLQTERLPRAISTESLQRIAHSTSQREASHDAAISRVFDAGEIKLNIRSGEVKVKLPADTLSELRDDVDSKLTTEETQYRAALLVRRMAMFVSPLENISLQDVESVVVLAFPTLFADPELPHIDGPPRSHFAHFAKMVFTKVDEFKWHIRRATPTSNDLYNTSPTTLWTAASQVVDTPSTTVSERACGSEAWSSWSLFDGRFWIRVRPRVTKQDQPSEISVRFLQIESLAALNKQERTRKEKRTAWWRLKGLLKVSAPGGARFTLPAIVESRPAGDQNKTVDRVVALPSVGWSDPQWQQTSGDRDCDMYNYWDIRYKKVDLCSKDDGKHDFVV
ncbi:hypothetical protein MBLNU457_1243t2 [Dothideomycetes sp. NU457]